MHAVLTAAPAAKPRPPSSLDPHPCPAALPVSFFSHAPLLCHTVHPLPVHYHQWQSCLARKSGGRQKGTSSILGSNTKVQRQWNSALGQGYTEQSGFYLNYKKDSKSTNVVGYLGSSDWISCLLFLATLFHKISLLHLLCWLLSALKAPLFANFFKKSMQITIKDAFISSKDQKPQWLKGT